MNVSIVAALLLIATPRMIAQKGCLRMFDEYGNRLKTTATIRYLAGDLANLSAECKREKIELDTAFMLIEAATQNLTELKTLLENRRANTND
jgi:uncharacterized membrane protein